MATSDNENELWSFITLGAATRNAIRYLRLEEKKDENAGNKRDPGDATEDRVTDNASKRKTI